MAFYTLNPRTGVKEQLVNAEYYPAYLFLPERAFINYPSILDSVTRFPRRFLWDPKSKDFVASDNFMLCIIDFYAALAWPAMAKMFGLCEYMEVYSGYDIAWQIAHAPSLWVSTMEAENILPVPSALFQSCSPFDFFGFVPDEELKEIMEYIVPLALKKHGLDKIIEIGIEYRCIEDFEFERNSNKKTDFYRKWYHSRTKLYKEAKNLQYQKRVEKKTEAQLIATLIDADDAATVEENKTTQRDPENWNTIHMRKRPEPADRDDMINCIETQVAVNDFLMQIPQEDYDLLMMGFQGKKQKEIAEALHLKTHSAVAKRRQKLITEFEKFSGVEINKKAIRRKKRQK